MSTSEILVVALVVFVPAALLWAVFVARTGRPGAPRRAAAGIPQAMRPAAPDEKLEGPRLERIQWTGFVSSIILAAFIVVYWLPEKGRQDHFVERFSEEAVHRGGLTYAKAPVLEDDADPAEFKELEEGIALGQGCATCHGAEGQGSIQQWTPPGRKKPINYNVPPLNNVFQRWDEEIVRFTIERGRPGTDMPAWGIDYGGSMTSQMVDDTIAWLRTLEGNQEPPPALPEDATGQQIFEARCAVCHGPKAQGKEDDNLWFQGMALWKGDVRHLTEEQHLATIRNGRRYAFMPQFAEAPAQYVPVPPYPLTDEQIEAVMEYERTL